MSVPELILASGSPRRRRLLEQLGLVFRVDAAEVDETALPGEDPVSHVERLAAAKARAVASGHPGALVIGGDTVVVLGDEILGKPSDPAHAVEMLMRLQGREHRVVTGVAVVAGDRSATAVVPVDVRFRRFDRRLAEAYVATGEPMDKAGAYGIQGFGAALVQEIQGDFFGVMGLPLRVVLELLERFGYRYTFTR